MGRLILSRKPGESIVIGDNVTVTIDGVQGKQVRVAVEAPPDVPVNREEVAERIAAEQEETNE